MEYKQKVLDFFSYTKRKNKQITIMVEKKNKYLSMSNDEFLFEYTNIEARYTHKKFILSVIVIAAVVTIINESWTRLYDFIIRLLMINNVGYIENDMIKVAEILVLIMMLFILFLGLLIIYKLLKSLYFLTKEKIFVEEIKEMRKAND